MRKRKDRPKRRFRFSLPARPTAQVFRNGSAATVLTVLAVAAVVLVNLIGNALPASVCQFDLSETKLYTLGDVSLGILDELEQDVTIYYLAQTGSVDSNVTALLDQYAGHSSHIQWQQKDPALYPGFARQMGVEDATDGSLIVVSGDRTRLVDSSVLYSSEFDYDTYSYTTSFDAENQITSAVQYVTGGELPVVYQLTGHGEATLSDGVQQALGLQNLELQELNLLTSDIPRGCGRTGDLCAQFGFCRGRRGSPAQLAAGRRADAGLHRSRGGYAQPEQPDGGLGPEPDRWSGD